MSFAFLFNLAIFFGLLWLAFTVYKLNGTKNDDQFKTRLPDR
jgi:hypothetical protein